MRHIICFASLVVLCRAIENWQPVLESDLYTKAQFQSVPSFSSLVAQRYQPNQGDQCGLYKVGFSQDLYFQYIQYKTHIPEMKEFTLCYWNKYGNHSTDHPLFSYAGK